jgi:hypothetical protein
MQSLLHLALLNIPLEKRYLLKTDSVLTTPFPSIPPYVFIAPDIRSFFVAGSTSTLLKNENDFIFPLASITEFIFFRESNGVQRMPVISMVLERRDQSI